MIPKFIVLSEHPNAKMRAHAIACLSYFVPIGCQSLFAHIDSFIACLFKRASDEDSAVRKHLCQALVLLLASRPEKLIPEMANVAEYMLYSTKDKHGNVALEACEFWLTFAEDPDLAPYLHPLLAKVAPVLLDCMAYSEDDLLWLQGDDEDAAVPDKDTDIKPRHYGGKAHGFERDANGDDGSQRRVGVCGEELDEREDEAYDDLDNENFADEMSTEWNLRKCAAAALDLLAVRFGAALLNVLLEPLKTKLWSDDWLQRESGILALGATAKGPEPVAWESQGSDSDRRSAGFIDAIEPHLHTLVPYLIDALNDPKVRLVGSSNFSAGMCSIVVSQPLVRSITCWTLGRYASWCTQPISPEHKNRFFAPTLEGVSVSVCVSGNQHVYVVRQLLRMVLDNNKRVQEAGCSAFATLEEDAGPELAPYLEPVLRSLVFAFEKYQNKNMLILYDAVGTLADAVGSALQNPTYVEILMPPLLKRWSKLKDDDHDLIPVLKVRFRPHVFDMAADTWPIVSCISYDRDGPGVPLVCHPDIRPVPHNRAYLPPSVPSLPAEPRDGRA